MNNEAPIHDMFWYDASELTVEGKGWTDTESFYERLPGRARGIVNEKQWIHSQCPAGVTVHFATNSSSLSVRWDAAKDHAGYTGLDLYVRHEGTWRWLAVAQATDDFNEKRLFQDLPVADREFMLYLPLFYQTQRVELGVTATAGLTPTAPRTQKPVVFYGTSITQGSRASRPGMTYSAILGRRLDRPVINLGFSGNGTMEPPFIDLLCELEPAIYVLNCLPNMTEPLINERVAPAVQKLRAAHPTTPIVLVDSIQYADAFLKPHRMDRYLTSNRVQYAIYEHLIANGMEQLHYLQDEDLIGVDGEATIDGTHFTDLGYMRFADKLCACLQRIFQEEIS